MIFYSLIIKTISFIHIQPFEYTCIYPQRFFIDETRIPFQNINIQLFFPLQQTTLMSEFMKNIYICKRSWEVIYAFIFIHGGLLLFRGKKDIFYAINFEAFKKILAVDFFRFVVSTDIANSNQNTSKLKLLKM